jgi:predicted ATP-binding protein involved in virulence
VRIDRLEIKNFKKFSDFNIDLHPQFTLLVGDNGTGKTTILDALAIAAGIWLVNSPDTTLNNSRRNILPSEIRLETLETDNMVQLTECTPVQIKAIGKINGQKVAWSRQIKMSSSKTSNAAAKEALEIISTLFQSVMAGNKIWMPIIAYYGAGRAWLASNQRSAKAASNLPSPSRRWDAFYDCFEERIRIGDLHTWFQKEVIASVNRQGQMRPGFDIVKYAILRCIPDFSNLWFDTEQSEIVVSIGGNPQPFRNLSAGQKMMVSLIADIAIKIVTQNAFFISKEFIINDNELPLVLQKTTGLVLIDELDVHLHPKWQRQVVDDLKSTFPAIQFVCTTHSPLIIGEIEAQEIRFLEYDQETGEDISKTPIESYGLDANRVLDELMGTSDRNKEISDSLHKLFQLIDEDDFDGARRAMIPIIEKVGESEPEITRARSLINFLEGNE